MGSYLDKPETTKKSATDENDYLKIGSSQMQGWRINQEDAHNSIPNFSENVSFFAVYDGHGGSEIAEYCSVKLPDFLKKLDSFKQGQYEQALKETFLGFDKTLLEENVIVELRQMARKNPDYDDSEMEDAEDDETAEEIINLHQEANMPLSEVLEKYKGSADKVSKIQTIHRILQQSQYSQQEAGEASSAGSSSSSSQKGTNGKNAASKQASSDPEVELVSSSSNKPESKKNNDSNEPSSSSSSHQPNDQAPDSTLTSIPSTSSKANAEEKPEQSTIESCGEELKDNADVKNRIKTQDTSDSENTISSSSVHNGDTGNCSSTSTIEGTNSSQTSAVACSTGLTQPNKISTTSSENQNDESETSSDCEQDKTYKESRFKKSKLSNDDDDDDDDDEEDDEEDASTDEDGEDEELEDDDEEMSNEDISGEEDEDGLDDDFMNNMDTEPGKASGCTAVVALMVGRNLYVANAGDSRCVVCRAGKVVEMSFDHKPEDDIEFERIKKAGGRVTMDGRVNGGLNLSRAIGDHGYKMNKELSAEEQMISAAPDLKKVVLEKEDEFMVLACDGIWNYMTNDEVVGFVKHRIASGKKTLSEICEELFHNCLAPNTMGDGTGCDNMTAIIVQFKPELFDLPTPNIDKPSLKRHFETEESELCAEEQCKKKAKIDDDLTPSAAVDMSKTTADS